MEVPEPRSVHPRLVMNGEIIGLFALAEEIDGRFTRYHFIDSPDPEHREEVLPFISTAVNTTSISGSMGVRPGSLSSLIDVMELTSYRIGVAA